MTWLQQVIYYYPHLIVFSNFKILIYLFVIFLKPNSFESSNNYGNILVWTINRTISVDMFAAGGQSQGGFVIVSQGDVSRD